MAVQAWRVHDTGLVAAPGPFRRLGGRVRHHRGSGDGWPDRITLELVDDQLVVTDAGGGVVGRWPRHEVDVHRTSDGPPVTFVLSVDGAAHLFAAPSAATTDALLDALVRSA